MNKDERYLELKEQLKSLPKRTLSVQEVINFYGYTPEVISKKLKTIDRNTKEGKEEWIKFLDKGFTKDELEFESDYYRKENNEKRLLEFLPTKEGHSPLKAIAFRNFKTEQDIWDALEGRLPVPVAILGSPNRLPEDLNLLELSKDAILYKKLHFKSLLQLDKYIRRHKEQLEILQAYLINKIDDIEREKVRYIGMEKKIIELKNSKNEIVSRQNITLEERHVKITEYLKATFPHEDKYPSEPTIRRWLDELSS